MGSKSTKRGGLVAVYVIECAICAAKSHPCGYPEMAWAAARGAGWEVPPASYRGPHCMDCRLSLFLAEEAP